jgi:hypothetical protein
MSERRLCVWENIGQFEKKSPAKHEWEVQSIEKCTLRSDQPKQFDVVFAPKPGEQRTKEALRTTSLMADNEDVTNICIHPSANQMDAVVNDN